MPEVLDIWGLRDRFNRLSINWIKAQCKAGKLPFLKAGKKLLFNPVAVTEALAKLAAEYPNAMPGNVAPTMAASTEAAHATR